MRTHTLCLTHAQTYTPMYTHVPPPPPPTHTHRRLLVALLLGQCLSLLLCGTGTSSQLLEAWYHLSVPTTQVFVVYVLLAAIFGPALATRKDFLRILRDNWWKYAILGILDVEGNYLVVLAYKYTTMTSIQVRMKRHVEPYIVIV